MDDDNGRDETLDELERDAERDRAGLVGAVEALRGRLSEGRDGLSETLSARARDYAERRRSKAAEGLWRRVEDHPLQTVALAAGVAYPALRIVTKIPAPILLLGAGVALVGRGGSGQAESRVDVEVEVEPAGDAGRDPPPVLGLGAPRVSTGDGAAPSAAVTGPSAREMGGRAMTQAGERAAQAGQAAGEAVAEAIRRNPALAGGASLLIGAALAAMLPRTRLEGRAFGEAAEDARERARSLAAEGMEAGRRALNAATDEAERQNLTAAGARDAIREGADRASETIRDAADEAQGAIEGSGKTGPGETSKG